MQCATCNAPHYAVKKEKEKKKKKRPMKIKIYVYLDLNKIIRLKFTANFDRCAMFIIRNCLTENFKS